MSPAQRKLTRKTQTLSPTSFKLLKVREIDVSLEKKKRRLKNLKSAWYYRKTAKGDMVTIKLNAQGDKTCQKETANKRLDES